MKHLFVSWLVLLSALAMAQVKPRNLLSGRYSVCTVQSALLPVADWNPFPKTPADWKVQLTDSARIDLVKAGDAARQQAWPAISASLTLEYVRSGDREQYRRAYFARRDQLMAIVLAESIEGKGRFTEAILNRVWSIGEESYRGVPAHLSVQRAGSGLPDVQDRTVALFGAETAALPALTDYFAGPTLDAISPLVGARIRYEVNQRIHEPLQHPDRYGYLAFGQGNAPVNNWNPWIVSNLMLTILLLESNETVRAEKLHKSMTMLDLYLNGLGDDGGCDEGPSYWFAAGGCVFDALDLLHRATNGRINIFDEPFLGKVAGYITTTHIADRYYVNFADADATIPTDGLLLFRFGQAIRDVSLTQFGAWATQRNPPSYVVKGNHRYRQILNLFARPSAMQTTARPARPATAYLADVQMMVARVGKGLFRAAHGGHNAESRNHNDVGDFILYADGQPVIVDAGAGTYTSKTFSKQRYALWFTQSGYHNLPTINGFEQRAGRVYQARNVRFDSTAQEKSKQMDIAPAYPTEARARLFQRTIRLRNNGELRIEDAYEIDSARVSLTQSFLTVCPVSQTQPGQLTFQTATGRIVTMHYVASDWQISVETVPLDQPDDVKFGVSWANRPMYRIRLRHRHPAPKGHYQFTFS